MKTKRLVIDINDLAGEKRDQLATDGDRQLWAEIDYIQDVIGYRVVQKSSGYSNHYWSLQEAIDAYNQL